MKGNYLEALKWYGKAADMGNAEAKYKMGKILYEEGKRYLLESCEQGYADAIKFVKEEQITECMVFSSPKPFGIFTEKGWNGTIEYSLNKINWYEWDGKRIDSNVIYMRGYGNTVITGYSHSSLRRWCFEAEDEIICKGNLESLLDYRTCSIGEHPKMEKYCYYEMFEGCTSLKEAPALPAMELVAGCYHSMFCGCTFLKEAPALPATELAVGCYVGMFRGCTFMKKAPALLATELAMGCYGRMFEGCTSLKEAPALPAMKLAKSCYDGMFWRCTSLKEAPALPATELAVGCYVGMFRGCTSLKDAPALLARE